uniref:DUF6534 domain-containing protein n=1 Tax=Kwoniella bestiolae CBS 10118 TaxID=1296100 RepID=A0A1B9G0D4_9TREE|nr:hypothetical protein I302_05944 [Kwoniella bestiolae CBS 10118]OCF24484.1 hypothetical protein I302_05944 [Kwoniella bestiolae CBS 10118]
MIASMAWTGMIISYALHIFVYNFGVFIVFLEMPYFTAFPIVGMGMTTAIQCFYIERSYRLNNRNPFLLVFLLACVSGEWTSIIILMIKVTSVASLLQASEAVPQVRAWQCMTLETDFVITLSLGWGLWSAKTGWSHTDALVKKLLIVTLETQLAPTLMMIAFVIDLSVKPSSTIGIFFDILIPKSYTVGYLATLNTRVHLRRDRSTHGSGNGKAADTNAYHLGTGRLQQATIKIDTETYTESFQIGRPTAGVNRRDMKDVSEEGSVENLDYASNLSKQNLNNPSSQF